MRLLKLFWVVLFLVIVQPVSGWAGNWPWSDQDFSAYVGNWKGNNFSYNKFPFAKEVELSFWLNAQGALEGAILFSKEGGYCVGHVKPDLAQERLVFSAKEGDLCPDLANSTFSLFRQLKGGVFGLRFHTPSSVNDLYNLTHFHKIAESNTKLQAFVSFFKESGQDVADIKNTQAQNYEKAISDIDAAMQQPYRLDFQDSRMIGVWEGSFVDGKKAYPAKMVYGNGVKSALDPCC